MRGPLRACPAPQGWAANIEGPSGGARAPALGLCPSRGQEFSPTVATQPWEGPGRSAQCPHCVARLAPCGHLEPGGAPAPSGLEGRLRAPARSPSRGGERPRTRPGRTPRRPPAQPSRPSRGARRSLLETSRLCRASERARERGVSGLGGAGGVAPAAGLRAQGA